VEEKSVTLICETDEGKYRPGTIRFQAKKGKSINLGKIQEAITATRLSGNTNMRVRYLEVTVRGDLVIKDDEPVLKVSGAQQEFWLAADDRVLDKPLREAAERNAEAVTVVGRVDCWNGRFPVVLKVFAKRYGKDGKKPILLVISSLETSEEKAEK
jgi:hypothetical protein